MKLEKKYLILLSLLFMIILGFNSASAADSSDVVDESSADLSLSSSSDLEMIDDSESSSEMISYESLS
ncbi:MAG: hypothetical protein MR277_07355, partial [Methanobrevibacter ruminantium]